MVDLETRLWVVHCGGLDQKDTQARTREMDGTNRVRQLHDCLDVGWHQTMPRAACLVHDARGLAGDHVKSECLYTVTHTHTNTMCLQY